MSIIRIAGAGLLGILALPVQAAQIIVVSLDSPGFGFNDTTPVAPVGGNPGTTLGQQRLNVLQRAGEIWAAYLYSEVPIRVQAQFSDFGGSVETGYVLAGASAIRDQIGFANAPDPNVLYPVALANSLAGVDLRPTENDINVTVNIAPDTDPALPSWYYGFDGNGTGLTDLLDVLLHEIGHGLGFYSRVDPNNGSFFLNTIDTYSLNLYDTQAQQFWAGMKNNVRKASITNDPHLVWRGAWTSAAQASILEAVRAISVAAPAAVAGEYAYEPAGFGPAVPAGGIGGLLVVVDDGTAPATDACEPIQNAGELSGKIAYISRGSCNFDAKVLNAQESGAIAVIIANNVTGGPALMGGSDVVNGIPLAIPAVSISLEDGQALLAQSPGVTLTIGVPSAQGLAGTNAGFIRMYAPDPYEGGSSVSHFSPSASPDLLMEPFINANLREDLDLSLTVLKDIGWVVLDIPYPHLTYELWSSGAFSPGASLTAVGDDPDGDGVLNIEEYFFGGDPEAPSLDLLPRMQPAGADLEVVYTRTRLATDLAYAYEVSGDLQVWAEAVEGVDYVEETVTSLGVSADQVRLRLLAPAPGSPQFVRLRVEPLP